MHSVRRNNTIEFTGDNIFGFFLVRKVSFCKKSLSKNSAAFLVKLFGQMWWDLFGCSVSELMIKLYKLNLCG